MDQILDRLYLGSLEDGKVARVPIAYILNLSNVLYDPPESRITTLSRWIPDRVALPWIIWDELVHELGYLLQRRRETVLVHCRLGKSRAPALVVAYLAWCGMTPDSALEVVQRKRNLVDVHPETWQSVLAWYEKV